MPSLSHNLTSPRIIILKGGLFLAAGVLATAILAADVLGGTPGRRTLLMHLLAIWCFARAYYFAFYVIHYYIDPTFHFAGIVSAIRWLATDGRARSAGAQPSQPNPAVPPFQDPPA